MSKKVLLIVLIIYSCDTGYFCYIENSAEQDIIFKIYPPLDNYFSEDYLSLNNTNIESDDTVGLYKLSNNKKIKFFGSIGNYVTVNTFPFEYLEIIFLDDTIQYTKKQIINLLKKSRVGNDYYIKIDSSFLIKYIRPDA